MVLTKKKPSDVAIKELIIFSGKLIFFSGNSRGYQSQYAIWCFRSLGSPRPVSLRYFSNMQFANHLTMFSEDVGPYL